MLLLVLLFLGISYAGQLEELINTALENSPRLKRYDYLASSAIKRGKYSLSLPNPVFYFGLSNLPTSKLYPTSKEPMSGYTIGISQMYTLPIKRQLENSVYKSQREEIRKDLEVEKKELIRDLKVKYLEWLYTFKREELLKKNLSEAAFLIRLAEENYRYAKATLSDVILARTKRIELESMLVGLQEERKTLEEEISYLVGKRVDLRPEEVDFHAPNTEDLSHSPYLERIKAQVERLKAELQRLKVEHYPDLELMLEYMVRPAMDNLVSLRVGFTIPVWKGKKEDLAVLSKEEEIRSKLEELKDTQLRLIREMNELKVQLEAKKRILKLLDDLLKEKETEAKALELAYTYSKADLRDVVKLYQELWDLRMKRLEVELSIQKLYPALEALI
ncbi:TolC family protein [Thermocrinis minervae]|nr:TolC family protein [Thermocrinis minervae]